MKTTDAIKLIRDELPPDAYIEQIQTSSGVPGQSFEKRFVGLDIMLSESQFSRQDALKTFNIIRFKLPDLCEASYEEEKDMEWVYHLKFNWLA